jgi:hypothetical protein
LVRAKCFFSGKKTFLKHILKNQASQLQEAILFLEIDALFNQVWFIYLSKANGEPPFHGE